MKPYFIATLVKTTPSTGAVDPRVFTGESPEEVHTKMKKYFLANNLDLRPSNGSEDAILHEIQEANQQDNGELQLVNMRDDSGTDFYCMYAWEIHNVSEDDAFFNAKNTQTVITVVEGNANVKDVCGVDACYHLFLDSHDVEKLSTRIQQVLCGENQFTLTISDDKGTLIAKRRNGGFYAFIIHDRKPQVKKEFIPLRFTADIDGRPEVIEVEVPIKDIDFVQDEDSWFYTFNYRCTMAGELISMEIWGTQDVFGNARLTGVTIMKNGTVLFAPNFGVNVFVNGDVVEQIDAIEVRDSAGKWNKLIPTITGTTYNGTEVRVSIVPDVEPNKGGFSCKVEKVDSGNLIDIFRIRPSDCDCRNLNTVVKYVKSYIEREECY